MPDALPEPKFVFVRRDTRKGPLQMPYDGPFEVVERSEKHFKLKLGSQLANVSVDLLKPAYLNETQPVAVAEPPRWGRPQKSPTT